MKKLFTCIFFLSQISTGFSAYSTASLWEDFKANTAPSALPMTFTPAHYKIFTLDQPGMKKFLATVPDNPDEALEIVLPTPESGTRTFLIWETPIMEAEMAALYPEIKTYTAVAKDNPYVSAKLDYTLYGFHAMVYEPGRSYGIDPYSLAADGYYTVYYTKDHKNLHSLQGCGFNNQSDLLPPDQAMPMDLNQGLARQNGSIRHTYRLAVSCTGEYAAAVTGLSSPAISQVQSQIASTINRVKGVYERELSVTFKLIVANSTIVYTDPATDPYSCNSNLDCLIDEVQANITAVVGSNNFDIGHIFCTAGGGLAGLAVVCDPTRKAEGTSTTGGPDDFGVIIHEMGHQFGANHTFSAETGGCNGNGAEPNAYEPGSGSTIMSYGGLCAANDIVSVSDDYFHVASLTEMSGFLLGQGGGCGSTENGTTPVQFVDPVDSFTIPANTPFELAGPVATAHQQGAGVYYSWEQFDLGNFGGTEASAGGEAEGPIFRSYLPDSLPLRDYPIELILNGSYTGLGERLPTVERELNFKLTARSVFQGWGTFKYTEEPVKLNVAASSGFRVNQPSSDQTWNPGEFKTVEWTVAGTDADPIFCNSVNIYLSLDDGESFPILLASNVPNTGSYDVLVQDVGTTEGRIKVQGLGNIFYDVAKGKLTITGTPPNSIGDIELNKHISIFPNPASDQIRIKYSKAVNQEELEVTLLNAVGQIIWKGEMQDELSIPVSSFSRGYYLVRIVDKASGKQSVQKVVLQ